MSKDFGSLSGPPDHGKMSIPVENDMHDEEGIGIAFNKDFEVGTDDKKSCKFINFCSGCLGCIGCKACGGCGGGGGSSQEITEEEIIL